MDANGEEANGTRWIKKTTENGSCCSIRDRTGEAVNPHVFRIAPQRQLDYSAIQRLIKESAQLISVKTSEE